LPPDALRSTAKSSQPQIVLPDIEQKVRMPETATVSRSTATRTSDGLHQNTPVLSVSVVSNVNHFDDLREEWSSLVERAHVTIFQTFEWQRTWWKHYSTKRFSLHIIVIRNGSRIVAIAPLYIEKAHAMGIISVRKLTFIGSGITDYLDFIIEPEWEERCITEIAQELARSTSRIDTIHLLDIPERSTNHRLLYEALSTRGFRGSHFINEYCPRLQLLGSWEETLASFPSAKQKRFRQVSKKIETDFAVDLQIASEKDSISSEFDEFFALHQKRWRDSGHTGVLADPRALAFHREVVALFFDRHMLFLAFLTLNGERVAANYSFLFHGECYHYLSGIDMRKDLEKYSVGRILQIYSIAAAARAGATVYDFMRGPEEYKYYFNSVDANNWAVLMYRSNSNWIEKKYKFILLFHSLQRRLTRERLLLKRVVAEHGLFSQAMLNHLQERWRTNLVEGERKLKAPEKSLLQGEKEKNTQ
jgi:CelD/BcsL family acetyltransferase involved in cellulose biosynthesis